MKPSTPSFAIIGASTGLGPAVARRFGRNGYSATLVSRNREKRDALAAELAADGLGVARFVADAGDPASIALALEAAGKRFGSINVLEFSPHAGNAESMVDPLDVTTENLHPAVDALVFRLTLTRI